MPLWLENTSSRLEIREVRVGDAQSGNDIPRRKFPPSEYRRPSLRQPAKANNNSFSWPNISSTVQELHNTESLSNSFVFPFDSTFRSQFRGLRTMALLQYRAPVNYEDHQRKSKLIFAIANAHYLQRHLRTSSRPSKLLPSLVSPAL
jgi:hypothetical protein